MLDHPTKAIDDEPRNMLGGMRQPLALTGRQKCAGDSEGVLFNFGVAVLW